MAGVTEVQGQVFAEGLAAPQLPASMAGLAVRPRTAPVAAEAEAGTGANWQGLAVVA